MAQLFKDDNSDTVVIPGEAYDPGGTYTEGAGSIKGGSGEVWGETGVGIPKCHWPYVLDGIGYTKVVTTPGKPALPGQSYIPPTVGQIDINKNVGWDNSCSSSIDPINAGQQITFKVYHDSRGFFVGLDTQGRELQYIGLYSVGLLFDQDGVSVFEYGQFVEKIASSFSPNDEFQIRRYSDGTVVYQINGAFAAKSQNTLVAHEDYYAYGIGYQAGDIITEAAIESFVQYLIPDDLIEFDQVGTSILSGSDLIEFDQVGTAVTQGIIIDFDQIGTASCGNLHNFVGDLNIEITVPRLHAEEGTDGYSSFDMEIAAISGSANDDYEPPRLSQFDMLVGPLVQDTDGIQVHTGEFDMDVTVPKLHAQQEDYSSLDMDITVPVPASYQSPAGYMPLYSDIKAEDYSTILKDVLIPLYIGLKATDNIPLFKDVIVTMTESLSVDDGFGNQPDRPSDPSQYGVVDFNQIDTSILSSSGIVDFDQIGTVILLDNEPYDPYGPADPYNPDTPDENVLVVFDQIETSSLSEGSLVEFDQTGTAVVLNNIQYNTAQILVEFDQIGTSLLSGSGLIELDQVGTAVLLENEQYDPYGPGDPYDPENPDSSVLTVFDQIGTSLLSGSGLIELDQIGTAVLLKNEPYDPYTPGGPPGPLDPSTPPFNADKQIEINEMCSVLDNMRFSLDDLPDFSGGVAWVMNIDTGATSLFLDYGFNSFLELDGELYGVSGGGIAKLQNTGATVPSSGIDYGLSNFGSPRKKRIPHFYAAVASSGKVYLRLLVDGYQAEYFALTSTDYVEPNKINAGRGFHAVYWNPMVIAPEGVLIEELDSLEWQPMVFPRRV